MTLELLALSSRGKMLADEAYEIGPNDQSTTVLSLKANARLLRDLSEGEGGACIEFLSASTARITCGDEEYELAIVESLPTVIV